MATTFDLDFGGLSLQAPSKPEDTGPIFHLFSTLPTELRLKIITHMLPQPSTLALTANILIADPTFGLYLVFMITPPTQPPASKSSSAFMFGNQAVKAPRKWYVEERRLNVLLVNREFRNVYLAAFPLSLPCGLSGPWHMAGQIRYSPDDAIMFRNFGLLVTKAMVVRALEQDWRLQEFWGQIENLHVSIEIANHELMDGCVAALERMRGLKRVKVLLWKGFGDNQEENVKVQLFNAFGERVKVVETTLREAIERDGQEDRMCPVFELLSNGEI